MAEESNNRVFLSYAHDNLEMVHKIYDGLVKRKVNVWFDKEHLKPGFWKRQIEEIIPHCRYFVICISEAALKKTGVEDPGFQGEELQQAYEIARVQLESSFTIIPVRLEDCDRGDHRMSPYQQYDLFVDFESELDHLAVNLGGVSLADRIAKDTRTDDEKMFDKLAGKAASLYYAGEFDKVLTTYDKALQIKPYDATSWVYKGFVLRGLGRNEESLEAFEKALEIEPNYASAWMWLVGSKSEKNRKIYSRSVGYGAAHFQR